MGFCNKTLQLYGIFTAKSIIIRDVHGTENVHWGVLNQGLSTYELIGNAAIGIRWKHTSDAQEDMD